MRSIQDFRYKLEGKKAVLVKSSQEWAEAFDKERHVADDFIEPLQEAPQETGRMARVAEELEPGAAPPEVAVEPIRVSTAFLGIDHNFTDDGPPMLFETMVFGGALDGDCDRTSTWEEAEKQHVETLTRVLQTLPPNVKVRSTLPNQR